MKKLLTILFLMPSILFAQSDYLQKEDIKTPDNKSGLSLSANVSASGKVNESVAITSIACRSVSYDVGFTYDGSNVLKQAQYQNRYIPTGILGVGWSMGFPRIVADVKETAARDDDEFFLNGVKLVCLSRPAYLVNQVGNRVWQFKTSKKMPYIVKYYESAVTLSGSTYIQTPLDYWEVINDKGQTYIYGNSDNTREQVIAWGNWIGDSRSTTGAVQLTTAWNIAQIKDQWNNQLSFTYTKVEQGINSTGPKHTEASYLQQILSGTGEKIVFTYNSKTSSEYYEPHIEAVEPDAYQERYEKLYLNDVQLFNRNNALIAKHELTYQTATAFGVDNTKRYLTQITRKSGLNNALPPQKFEYYTTGTFAGALKKKTSMQGGSVTYTYEEKTLFTNDNTKNLNGLAVPHNATSSRYAHYESDKYRLELYTYENNLLPSCADGSGTVHFYIDRYTWTGRVWKLERFFIPDGVMVYTDTSCLNFLDNIKFVMEEDFYAILCFDRSTKKGNVYYHHLRNDGTWYQSQHSYINTDGQVNDPTQDPTLMSGDNFLAVGSYTGYLNTYVWNNDYWISTSISQNTGKYSYSARNNFIMASDITAGVDMTATVDPANGISHTDKYYFHFLNGEKKWWTKSWSHVLDPLIANISSQSAFYPSNSSAGFVAGDDSESIWMWDSNYNFTSLSTVGNYNDDYPLMSVGNNIFVGYQVGDTTRPNIYKMAAISGTSIYYMPSTIYDTEQGFGINRTLGLRWNGTVNDYSHMLTTFNPNTTSWVGTSMPLISKANNEHYMSSYAFADDVFLCEHIAYKLTNSGYVSLGQVTSYDYPQSAMSSGNYIRLAGWNNTIPKTGEEKYFYIDPKTGTLQIVQTSALYQNLWTARNKGSEAFGGATPFYTRRNWNGKRMIDNKMNNVITDVVVSKTEADNGSGQIIVLSYTYENSTTLPDDSTVIYATVTTEEKGAGTATNGYTKTYYNDGTLDSSRSGQLVRMEYYNSDNIKLKEIIPTYTKTLYSFQNSYGTVVYYNPYNWIKTNEQEIFYYGASQLTNNMTYTYDTNGNLLTSERISSDGKTEKTTLVYAETQYPVLVNRNMIGFVYKKTNMIGSNVVSVERINWTDDGTHSYITENQSGVTEALLRTNSTISKMDNYGNVVETIDNKNRYNTVLVGHNYTYPVATIKNASYNDVVAALEVPYATLQTLSGAALKTELMKLYNNLPKTCLIIISSYDDYGNIINTVDARKNESNTIYDDFQRTKYVTDKNGKLLAVKKYNFKP